VSVYHHRLVTHTDSRISRPAGRRPWNTQGFTLLELSVVLFIISAVAALAVPAIKKINLEARSTTVVNDLRIFAGAMQTYAQERGDWPAGNSEPGVFPPGMEGYLRTTNWERKTPIGGFYTWSPNTMHQGQRYRAAISISTVGEDKVSSDRMQLTDLDRKLDDGSLDTGNLRLGFRNYPLYVLEP
jgi:prepilin-type N-terminal cleavage/methylation domain-containing protein